MTIKQQALNMIKKAKALDNNDFGKNILGFSFKELLANPDDQYLNRELWEEYTCESGLSDIGYYSFKAYLADRYVAEYNDALVELDWENREDQY